MATIEEVIVRIGADISNYSRNVQKAGQEIQTLGKSASDLGSSLASSFGGYALAVGGALGYTVKSAASFDSAMRKAGAIAGATGEEFDAMKAAAIDLGAKTSLSASEVADAMTELAAKGFDANQTIAAMPAIVSAAEASGEDLALVSDVVASALNSFGMEAGEAGKVADVLAETANRTAAGVGDLQYAFKYAAPVAHQLGVSLEELSAATGIMTNAGMKGEQAGTTLRSAMLRLIDPPKAAANTMEALGVSATDANGEFVGLTGIVEQLIKGTEGMTDANRAAAISTIFGTEAVSGMLNLMQAGPEAIDAMTVSLEDSAGASAAAAEKMKAGIGGALENLSGAFDSFAIVIGDTLTPIVADLARWLSELVDKLTNMPAPLRKFLVFGAAISAVLAGLVAIIGVVLMAIGSMITAVGTITTAVGKFIAPVGRFLSSLKPAAGQVGKITRVVGFLGKAFRVLTGPIGWVITGVLLFVKALERLWKTHEGFRDKVTEIWGQITGVFKKAKDAIVETFGPAIESIKKALQPLGNAFKNLFSRIGGWFKGEGSKFFAAWGDGIIKVLTGIQKAFEFVFPYIEKIVSGAWRFISDAVEEGTRYIVGIIEAFTLLLNGDFSAAWKKYKETVQNYVEGIGGVIREHVEAWKNTFTTKLEEIKNSIVEKITGWGISIATWFTTTRTNITEKLAEWGVSIDAWFAAMPETIITALEGWKTALNNWMDTQNELNKEKFGEWWTAIQEEFLSIPEQLTTWLGEWWTSIGTWYDTTKENITTKLGEWWTGIGNWFATRPAEIETELEGWWTKISTWFSEVPARIEKKLEEWWTAIKSWFAAVPDKPEVKNAGKNMIDKVSEGNKEKEKDFTEKLGKLIVDVIGAALAVAVVAIIAAGRELITRMIDGINEQKPFAESAVGKILTAITNKVKEIDLLQAGKDAIQGLINGISSKVEDVKNAAAEAAKAIPAGIAKLLKLRSPSRLLQGQGADAIQGLINGMLQLRNRVAKTAGEIAAAAVPDLQPVDLAGVGAADFGSVTASMEPALARIETDLQQGAQPATIRLNLGGREYETFVEDITDAQERKAYTLKIFKG